MNLILLDPSDATNDATNASSPPSIYYLSSDDRRTKHIVNHLKADTVKVGLTSCGLVGVASVEIDASSGGVTLLTSSLSQPPPLPQVSLIIGMPHPDAIRKLFPTLGSLGLQSISFVSSELSDPSYKATSALWQKKYLPLLREGLAQCGRPITPEVHTLHKVKGFDKALDAAITASKLKEDVVKIALDLDSSLPRIKDVTERCKSAVLAIGPERGWSKDDIETLENRGFTRCQMGPLVYKVHVAVTSAVALVQDAIGDVFDDRIYGNAYSILTGFVRSLTTTEIFSRLRSKGLGLSYDEKGKRSLNMDDLLAIQESMLGEGENHMIFELMTYRKGKPMKGWGGEYFVGKEWGRLSNISCKEEAQLEEQVRLALLASRTTSSSEISGGDDVVFIRLCALNALEPNTSASTLTQSMIETFDRATLGVCNLRDTSRLQPEGNDDLIYGDFTLQGVKTVYDVIRSMAKINTWIDMGCGSGLVMLGLKLIDANVDVVGVEIVKPLVDVARRMIEEFGLAKSRVIEGDFLMSKGMWLYDDPVIVFCHSTVVFKEKSMERLGDRAALLPRGSFIVCVGRGIVGEGLEVVKEILGRAEWGAEKVVILKKN